MPEYTFVRGGTNASPGLYLSWVVEADSIEEAVTVSRNLFEDDEPLEVEHAEVECDKQRVSGLVLRADPKEIRAEDIVDVYAPETEAYGS